MGLTLAEKRAVAVYAAGKDFGAGAAAAGRCSASAPAFTLDGPEWAGWGAGPENARFQPKPGLSPADLSRLKVRWAFGFPGSILAYGAPAVAGGRVFVGSAGGEFYALDARTGCIHWSYTAEASVRAAPSVGRLKDGRTAVFFGDQSARLYALDAARGTPLWQTVVDDQIAAVITGAPKLHDGRLYVPISVVEDILTPDPKYPCCRARGALAAVDAETGKILWKAHSVVDPPQKVGTNSAGTDRWGPSGASIWNSPTIDAVKGAVYVGTGNNHSNPPTDSSDAILAFEMATGKLLWKQQLTPGGDAWNIACGMNGPNCPENPGPDHDVGASTILRTLPGGRRVLIAGAKSSKIHALDPDKNGAVLWTDQLGRGGALGGIEWGMAADDTTVYVPLSDLSFGTDMMAGKPSPAAGGGLFAYQFADWHQALARAGNHLRRASRLLARAVAGGDRHPRGGVLWHHRRAAPRLLQRRWTRAVGVRHGPRFRDRQRRQGPRRHAQRRRSGGRGRHGARRVGLWPVRPDSGQRAALPVGGRAVKGGQGSGLGVRGSGLGGSRLNRSESRARTPESRTPE